MTSSDQESIQRYTAAGADFVERLTSSPQIGALASAVVDVGGLVLVSDRRFRAAERRRALRIDEGRAEIDFRIAEKYNRMAIDELTSTVPNLLREVQATLEPGKGTPKNLELDVIEETLREQLADMDIKGSSAEAMDQEMRRCFERARSSGATGVCEVMDEKLEELIDLRRRRATQNDPTTVIFGTIFLVAGVIHMISCATSGTCGTPGNIALAMLLFALAGAFFAAGVGMLVY